MKENLSLTANFITNLFIPLAGTYYGLFTESTTSPQTNNSGLITMQLDNCGFFTAKITIGSKSYPLSGQFIDNQDGTASCTDMMIPGNSSGRGETNGERHRRMFWT